MATAGEMKPYRGSCHCGRVQFEVRTELTRVSECNCSICRRKGYLHHMVSPDRFRLLQGQDALAAYQFGTGRAVHHFCRYCGVASFYRPRARPENYMINARCLEGVDLTPWSAFASMASVGRSVPMHHTRKSGRSSEAMNDCTSMVSKALARCR
jgi:hypothetical protein